MNKNNLKINIFSLVISSIFLVFNGCGSFEGVSYYSTDGIYNSENKLNLNANKLESNNSMDQSASYYENYFKNFSNDTSNQMDNDSNSLNEDKTVYVIDNSPNIRFGFGYGGFNSFNYWNNWAFNDFWSPYNSFSNNRFFWPYFNPYWDYGYQGMYFNNAWGYGYSLYGWNAYDPYNYINSNRGRYGRKVAYNRGSVGRNSNNSIRGISTTNFNTRGAGRVSGENTMRSNGRRNIKINTTRGGSRTINRSSNNRSFSGTRSSVGSRSSSGSRSGRGGRKN